MYGHVRSHVYGHVRSHVYGHVRSHVYGHVRSHVYSSTMAPLTGVIFHPSSNIAATSLPLDKEPTRYQSTHGTSMCMHVRTRAHTDVRTDGRMDAPTLRCTDGWRRLLSLENWGTTWMSCEAEMSVCSSSECMISSTEARYSGIPRSRNLIKMPKTWRHPNSIQACIPHLPPFIHPSVHPSVCLSVCPAIHPSTHPSIPPSHRSTHACIHSPSTPHSWPTNLLPTLTEMVPG